MTTQQTDVPKHIGIILDGNRRWAKEHGVTAFEGHKRGYELLKDIADVLIERGVEYVSVYAFSTENWQRSETEVSNLMKLAMLLATKEVKTLNNKDIRVRFLGSRQRLSPKLIKAIKAAEEATKNNSRGTVAVCFNYGGQQEIIDAVRQIVRDGLPADQVDYSAIEERLYAPEVPPVDLVLRTSGEMRLSNFMLWRAAYAEFIFMDKNWPDFTEADIDKVFSIYAARHRRKGV